MPNDKLIAFQEKNCKGCKFADENAGTGKRCCTFPGTPNITPARCWSKRKIERTT